MLRCQVVALCRLFPGWCKWKDLGYHLCDWCLEGHRIPFGQRSFSWSSCKETNMSHQFFPELSIRAKSLLKIAVCASARYQWTRRKIASGILWSIQRYLYSDFLDQTVSDRSEWATFGSSRANWVFLCCFYCCKFVQFLDWFSFWLVSIAFLGLRNHHNRRHRCRRSSTGRDPILLGSEIP